MPGLTASFTHYRPKVYRGTYSYNARLKIEAACRRKWRRAVFPDMKG